MVGEKRFVRVDVRDNKIFPTCTANYCTIAQAIAIDGTTYEHDVVIDRGEVRKRKKKPSKKFRAAFGHTPISQKEAIPWKCRQLLIGTGTGALPIMDEVKKEAKRRKIKLVILPTKKAIQELKKESSETNAILHVTC